MRLNSTAVSIIFEEDCPYFFTFQKWKKLFQKLFQELSTFSFKIVHFVTFLLETVELFFHSKQSSSLLFHSKVY